MAIEREGQLELSFEGGGTRQIKTGAEESGVVSTERLPEDQVQREIIRTELDTNLMVLAGAGAGKTYELVERMVALLSSSHDGDPVEIRHLAAITFTRKAAGELRTRFYERLMGEVRKHPTGPAGERLREAAARIDQCFIGTIHAFCSRLLRERPLEAGLPFDFRELDERDEPRARRRAWTQFLNERLRAGDKRLQGLLEINFNADDLYDFFTRRNEFPELKLKPTAVSEPDLAAAVEATEALVRESVPLLTAEGREKPGKWGEAAMKALEFMRKRPLVTSADRAEFLTLFESKSLVSGAVKVTRYTDKAYAYRLRDTLVPQLKEQVIDPSLRAWKQYVYALIGGLVDEAKDFYADVRGQAGAVTFSDLLIRTATVLKENPEVRAYFQNRYQRILVDEFQDTDPVQAEILFYLTGADNRERDWRKLAPRPGTLFVVGDEKQSIYRFRRADVDTFRFVRDRIEQTGGRIVSLNTSFRSLGHLCDWLNGTFENIFSAEDARYQSEYGRLLRYRPDGEDVSCVRKIQLAKPDGGRGAMVKVEAGLIADFIAAARAGSTAFNGSGGGAILSERPSYGSFMILVWTRRFVDTYAQALEARGIAYDVVGGGDLGKSEEVEALTLMFEAIADPKDTTKLVGYLRGPLVGMSDVDLLEIRKSVRRFEVRMTEFDSLDSDIALRLDAAYQRLRDARERLRSLAPAAAIEQIVDRLGLIPWSSASSDFLGSSRAGALNRLLANIRRWERQGLHWVDMVHEMRALIDEEDYEIQGLTLEAGQENAVRIMNLHQAKGLEADVVFLADPAGMGRDGPPDFHVSRFGGEPYLSMAVQKKRGWSYKTIAEPEGWPEDEEREALYLKAETTRLRYVAATRARNLLVVSVEEGAKKGPWHALEPYLLRLDELERAPSAQAPSRDEQPTEFRDEIRVREKAWEGIVEPSWEVATASAEGEDHFLFLSGEQRGADFGSVVHQLFDDALNGRVEDVATYLQTSTTLDDRDRDAAVRALSGFQSSLISSQAQASDELLTEVSFGGRQSEKPDIIFRGRIDLVYRFNDGWKIVDYKTDAAANDVEAEAVVGRYRDQVAAYAKYWSEITGEPVIEKGLWLTELNRFVPID